MKTLNIGRDSANDIVINDSKVSRRHIIIICENGIYTIKDLESTNGTFVNGHRINDVAQITSKDVVKIGNTVLDWERYFQLKEKKNSHKKSIWIYATVASIFLIVAISSFFITRKEKMVEPMKITIKMHEKNGVRYIPIKINGQELNFVFDTGASSICISTLEASVLYKNGTLTKEDFISTENFLDASGNINEGLKIKLRTIQIGDKIIENVEATIIKNPDAVCLFGQTALSKFGKYTIDNENNVITFE